jgi:hypothetical protein
MMKNRKGFTIKSILLFLVVILAFPCVVLAEIDKDIRFKMGSASGSDRIEFGNTIGHGSSNNGTNAQVEVVLGPHRDSAASFIMAIGLFYRHHPGDIQNLSIPIKVDYSVGGMSIAPGIRLRGSDTWSFEGKVEVGVGNAGKVTLDSPGVDWNATKKGNYGSLSLIAGYYYLFKNSASRVGFEVGMQKFYGDFKICSNSGYWSLGNVSGTGGTANLIYGIKF